MSSRLWLLLLVPALVLVVWGVASQLPRWTAPQPNWFAAATPGVCAAVDSLRLYHGQPTNAALELGGEDAQRIAAQVAADHYDSPVLAFSQPLAVRAALPGDSQRAYYVITAQLSDAAAVIYLDAVSGDTRALLTAPNDPSVGCDFDTRAALIDAVRSPPAVLLVAYVLLTAGALVARRLLRAKGKRP